MTAHKLSKKILLFIRYINIHYFHALSFKDSLAYFAIWAQLFINIFNALEYPLRFNTLNWLQSFFLRF
ncbi:hypothetical protein AT238_02055 [Bartonella henselae]|nr:hypothetical protein AT238_02055 [Bartonella henselae]PNM38203.1 hypothetical protein AL470_001720 [Bartonella henselae str. Houston-1]